MIKQRIKRDFIDFNDTDELLNILKTKFSNRKLYIRYDVDKTEISINEFNDDGSIMVVTDTSSTHEDIISIYGLIDKYIEFDLKILDELGPGYYRCKLISGRRANKGRRDLRFKVEDGEVYSTKFKISKHTIDVSNFKIPTSIKVVLDQFQSSNSKLSDIVKVDILSSEDKNFVLKIARKTGKALFIPNTEEVESYNAFNDEFIDVASVLGDDLKKYMQINIQKGYKSILLVPIIYLSDKEESIPFAYIQMISKSEYFDIEHVLNLKDHSFKLVDRIRSANTIVVSAHQGLYDISRGGAKLKIADKDLQKYMIKSKGFIFDLVFKLQAPITMYGEIKSIIKSDKDLLVGIDFEGNSSRKGELKRFYSIIKPMEVTYKSKLIKSLRGDG
jgi:uncharacterized protein DUF1577